MRPRFTAVVCTADRGARILPTLEALLAQDEDMPILVVDQGTAPAALPADAGTRVRVLRDDGRGLSRARNVACRETTTEWVFFVDDDCVVEPGWAQALGDALERHPEIDHVSGTVVPGGLPPNRPVQVATFDAAPARVVQGRWVLPWKIGLGVCFGIRRVTALRLGGWDERFGAGTQPFPAAEDMDLNVRLLRAGGRSLTVPTAVARHEQWRSEDDLPAHLGGYMRAWSGLAMKTARTDSALAGAWLWVDGLADLARTTVGALRRRSPLLARIVAHKVRGLVNGTRAGWRMPW